MYLNAVKKSKELILLVKMVLVLILSKPMAMNK
jgi:hypothetical protein